VQQRASDPWGICILNAAAHLLFYYCICKGTLALEDLVKNNYAMPSHSIIQHKIRRTLLLDVYYTKHFEKDIRPSCFRYYTLVL